MTPFERTAATDLAQLSADDKIDLFCDEFERHWQSGSRPNLEEFLNGSNANLNEGDVERLFSELLLLDIAFRRKTGEIFQAEDYVQRFPQYAGMIRIAFSSVDSDEIGKTAPYTLRTSRSGKIGQQIGRFQLIKHAGGGGFGDVWRARDTSLQRTVALKLPKAGELSDDELRRFVREGQAAAQLNHPNIVAVHEVGQLKDTAYIVSDYIHGTNLRKWLARGPELSVLLELCAKIADGVEHAHQRGVIHRDLKPGNILVDFDGEPHITDFGLAKWTGDASGLTQQGAMLGTPVYMSPEQARGDSAKVDHRTDVYSLGVLLYELITGDRPFSGDYAQVFQATIHDEPPAPRMKSREIPRDVETICLKAMAKDPAQRYASAAELAVDLRRYLRGEPILARPVGVIARSWRWMKRRPAGATAVIFATIAVFTGLVAVTVSRENYALLGYRTITLTTDPPGAHVTFTPLDPDTGQPQWDKSVHSDGVSPVMEELRPGEYFVTAILDEQRFHEVYRRVPGKGHVQVESYHHQFWSKRADGTISLPDITISPFDRRGMTLVSAADIAGPNAGNVRTGTQASTLSPFYIDRRRAPYEVVSEHLRGRAPQQNDETNEQVFAEVNFDEAVHVAELLGKRLPTLAELERAEAFSSTQATALDSAADADSEVDGVDFIPTEGAEWTTSRHFSSGTQAFEHYRLVYSRLGATNAKRNDVVTDRSEVLAGQARHRSTVTPGLGFRCARSAAPAVLTIGSID